MGCTGRRNCSYHLPAMRIRGGISLGSWTYSYLRDGRSLGTVVVLEVKCSVIYIPLRALRQEPQCPDCERVRLHSRRLRDIPQGFRPTRLSSGYQGLVQRPTILLYLHMRIRGGLCNGKVASNCARWARLSQKQIAIGIAICAFLYTFSRFL